MIAMTQIAPTNNVIRSRFFSTTLDPDRLDCIPPPNRLDRPPPRPRCSRISSTSSTLETISTICRASSIRRPICFVRGPSTVPSRSAARREVASS